MFMSRRLRPCIVHAVVLSTAIVGCTSKTHPSEVPGERITYRLEDTTVSPAAVTTSVVEYARPYLARTTTYEGPDSASPLQGGFIWTADALYTVTPDGAIQQTQLVPPSVAAPATRFDVALPIAETQHLVARLGTSVVLGRGCTLWSSKEPLDGLEISAPTKVDHTTSCVDAQGVLLSERWVLGSKLVRTRTATAVESTIGLTARTVFTASPTPVPGGFSEEAVTPIRLDEQGFGITLGLPPGFGLDRSVKTARSIGGGPTPTVVRIGEVDAYRSGEQLMVLRRTKDLVGTAIPSSRGSVVELGALGRGRLEPIATGCRVTVLTKGILVVATSTAGPDALLTWLRTARVQ